MVHSSATKLDENLNDTYCNLSNMKQTSSPASPRTRPQPRRSNSLILSTLVTLVVAAIQPGLVSADPNLPGWGGYAPNDPNACIILDQANQFRAQHRKPALIGDARLDQAAAVQCQLMIRTNRLEHDVGDGGPSVRVTNQRYNWQGVAENLYNEDNFPDMNVMRAVDGWEKSPGKA